MTSEFVCGLTNHLITDCSYSFRFSLRKDSLATMKVESLRWRLNLQILFIKLGRATLFSMS